MPRRPRKITPGRVYHLISRLVDRNWFIATESERRVYLELLGRSLQESDWRCLAFAVMSNHIHLATLAGAQPLHRWIRRVHSPFAQWLNRRYDRIGSVFVRGPKDWVVAPHRLRNVIAYIHKNPVRAGLCDIAANSSWTSHRAYVGAAPTPAWLDIDEGMIRMGFSDADALEQWTDDPGSTLPSDDLHDPEDDDVSVIAAPSDVARPAAGLVVAATAAHLDLSVERLCSKRRGITERFGREVAVRCAARLGLTGVEIASALRISQQGESVIRRRVIDLASVIDACNGVMTRLSSSASSV